jgi:hypothetical protein
MGQPAACMIESKGLPGAVGGLGDYGAAGTECVCRFAIVDGFARYGLCFR